MAALAGLPWWPSAVALVAFDLVTLPAAVAIFAGRTEVGAAERTADPGVTPLSR